MRGASGGHSDVAAGLNLPIVVAPLIRSRIPTVVERCTTVVTPGATVGVLVTDHGITVIGSYDPNRLGLTEEDFYDGLHVKESGILKFFGGLAADGTPEAGSVTNSALLAVNPADDPARAEAESAAAA